MAKQTQHSGRRKSSSVSPGPVVQVVVDVKGSCWRAPGCHRRTAVVGSGRGLTYLSGWVRAGPYLEVEAGEVVRP